MKVVEIKSAKEVQICSKCDAYIHVGRPYKKITPVNSPIIVACPLCDFTRLDKTESPYLKLVYEFMDSWESTYSFNSMGIHHMCIDLNKLLSKVKELKLNSDLMKVRAESISITIKKLENIDLSNTKIILSDEDTSVVEGSFNDTTEVIFDEVMLKIENCLKNILQR